MPTAYSMCVVEAKMCRTTETDHAVVSICVSPSSTAPFVFLNILAESQAETHKSDPRMQQQSFILLAHTKHVTKQKEGKKQRGTRPRSTVFWLVNTQRCRGAWVGGHTSFGHSHKLWTLMVHKGCRREGLRFLPRCQVPCSSFISLRTAEENKHQGVVQAL